MLPVCLVILNQNHTKKRKLTYYYQYIRVFLAFILWKYNIIHRKYHLPYHVLLVNNYYPLPYYAPPFH